MLLGNKASYLEGLAEGLELGDSKQEKLIKELISLVNDMANTVDSFNDRISMLDVYCDEIDHDLGDLEKYVYADSDDCCDCEDECDSESYDIEKVCPKCGESFFMSESDYQLGEVLCPYCNEKILLDDLPFDFSDNSCDCDDCCQNHKN